MSFEIGSMHSLRSCGQFATSIIRMPRLSAEERGRAFGMLEAGVHPTCVARHFGCSKVTIHNLISRHQETGSLDDRPRSGRPRVTTPQQDRYIRLQHLRDRFLPASRTAAATVGTHGRPISSRTARRRLAASRILCRRPVRGPILTARIRQQRLVWAQQRQRCTQRR